MLVHYLFLAKLSSRSNVCYACCIPQHTHIPVTYIVSFSEHALGCVCATEYSMARLNMYDTEALLLGHYQCCSVLEVFRVYTIVEECMYPQSNIGL